MLRIGRRVRLLAFQSKRISEETFAHEKLNQNKTNAATATVVRSKRTNKHSHRAFDSLSSIRQTLCSTCYRRLFLFHFSVIRCDNARTKWANRIEKRSFLYETRILVPEYVCTNRKGERNARTSIRNEQIK